MQLRTQVLFVAVSSVVAASAAAQSVDWRAEIGADMVRVVDGKMVYEQYEICGVEGGGARIQIKYYAEAPTGAGISRDYFISQTVALDTFVVYGSIAEASGLSLSAFLEAFDCDPIGAPIGTVDMELNVYMTGDGFQLEIVDTTTGTRTRSASTWAEVYAD
ncbi:MAG: hypothetical protein H6698_09390 [Myxococcales bacterium]|nr:hypothetical protein [Myxococcales bacterium]